MSHFWVLFIVSCSWTHHRILCSWTRKSRNGVHFPESSAERFTFLASIRSSVPFLNALRSGLLTFFSSLVIQESLINFAGERLRSKTDSHCESVFLLLSFCLVSWSWVRLRRKRVHFPTHTHIVFNDACVGLVQWSISTREDSHLIVYRWLWRLNLQ